MCSSQRGELTIRSLEFQCRDTVIRRNSKQSEKTRVSAKEKEEVSRLIYKESILIA